MEAGQRQELCRLAVQGGASLPAQVQAGQHLPAFVFKPQYTRDPQARHLALLIDVHFARSWWEAPLAIPLFRMQCAFGQERQQMLALGVACEEAASSEAWDPANP